MQSGRLVLRVVPPVHSKEGMDSYWSQEDLDFGAVSRLLVFEIGIRRAEGIGDLFRGSVNLPARCNYFAAAPAMIPPECIH